MPNAPLLLSLLVACTGEPEPADSGAADTSEVVVAGSPGCANDAFFDDGEHTLDVGGRTRTFVVRNPTGDTPPGGWPLVYALHGNGTGTWYWDLEGTTQDLRGPLAEHAILVIPEAIDQQWRDYDADPSTWPGRVDEELVFFDALHAVVRDTLCVDEDRVHAVGFSGGGSFSFVLGCRREWVRGIGIGGAVLYVEPETCVHTPAAWVTIGQEELAAGREKLRDTLAERAGCTAEEAPTEGCLSYSGCGADTPVTYCTHPGGHNWPDFASEAARDFLLGL